MATSLGHPNPIHTREPVNILLVDDQPGKLLTYEAILKDLGENLVKASSAREALEQLLKSDFAVILVDVCMPDQDGFELVETIREHHRFSETAVIFVSAIQLSDLDHLKGYASGAVDYVSVPVVPDILRAKVAIFVDLYRKTRELARLNDELEQRVLDRTNALMETQSALKESDRRKDEFLAMLAHELRNPLAPMQNSLDLLRRLKVEDPMVTTIEDILGRQLAQMTRLIDDLMDVSRINRGKLELRKVDADVRDILTNAIESARPAIDKANQTLVIDEPGETIVIQADPARLAQVLSNLLNNACRYTPAGGEIHLEVKKADREITFTVRDNGIGMEADDLTRVFEPFNQATNSLYRGKGGLGIGLTLVRTIVEGHNGRVTAYSEGLGKGCEFVVKIPTRGVIFAESSSEGDERSFMEHPTRRILVVDDNHDAAQSLATLLTHFGHEVHVAYNGREAIDRAKEALPEVIFMDVGMPEMNGYEAAQVLKSEPWGQNVLLVAITGWGQKEDRLKTAEAGFDRHLVKPVSFKDIETVLRESNML